MLFFSGEEVSDGTPLKYAYYMYFVALESRQSIVMLYIFQQTIYNSLTLVMFWKYVWIHMIFWQFLEINLYFQMICC